MTPEQEHRRALVHEVMATLAVCGILVLSLGTLIYLRYSSPTPPTITEVTYTAQELRHLEVLDSCAADFILRTTIEARKENYDPAEDLKEIVAAREWSSDLIAKHTMIPVEPLPAR